MKIIAEQALEIGHHSAFQSGRAGSEFCGARSFLLQDDEQGHVITLGIVASGFGGGAQAERSSHLASLVLRRHFAQSDSSDVLGLLSSGLGEANRLIFEQGQVLSEDDVPAGTSLAAAVVFENKLYVANIGNCRIYLQRQGGPLTQITFDHTQSPRTGEASTMAPPGQAGVERYLGQDLDVTPDFRLRLESEQSDEQMVGNQGTELQPGDTLLLMTGGVARAVPDERIEKILNQDRPERAAERLTRAALARNSEQSASALLLHMPHGQTLPGAWTPRSILLYGALGLIGLFFVVGVVLGARQLLLPHPTSTPTLTVMPADTGTPEPPTAVPSETLTLLPKASPTEVAIPTFTLLPSPTSTASPTRPRPTPAPTATASLTPEPSPTPTNTRVRTQPLPSITLTLSVTPTNTWAPPPPQPTSTQPPPPTDVPVPSDTPAPPPTNTPRPTATNPRPTATP